MSYQLINGHWIDNWPWPNIAEHCPKLPDSPVENMANLLGEVHSATDIEALEETLRDDAKRRNLYYLLEVALEHVGELRRELEALLRRANEREKDA